jgi:fatty-acyl-CoA synthase
MPPHAGLPVDAADVPLQRLVLPLDHGANAGTSVCLRKVDPALIFELIREHRVTHMCGAPIVYGMLINAPVAAQGIEHKVTA